MVLGSPKQRSLLPGVTWDAAFDYATDVLRRAMARPLAARPSAVEPVMMSWRFGVSPRPFTTSPRSFSDVSFPSMLVSPSLRRMVVVMLRVPMIGCDWPPAPA